MYDLISRQAATQTALEFIGEYLGFYKDLQRKLKERINALPPAQPAQQWIPCSERLPEVNTRCLCTYENEEGSCIDFGLYMKHGWFVSGVTAWMPLPEPYQEVEQNE